MRRRHRCRPKRCRRCPVAQSRRRPFPRAWEERLPSLPSKNKTAGRCCARCLQENPPQRKASDSPKNLLVNSVPLTAKKLAFASWAMMRASYGFAGAGRAEKERIPQTGCSLSRSSEDFDFRIKLGLRRLPAPLRECHPCQARSARSFPGGHMFGEMAKRRRLSAEAHRRSAARGALPAFLFENLSD